MTNTAKNKTSNKTLNMLINDVRKQSTALILTSIRVMGGGFLDMPERLVRAALFEVYFEREGSDALDDLMDELGMGMRA